MPTPTEPQAKFLLRAWQRDKTTIRDDYRTSTEKACIQRGWIAATGEAVEFQNSHVVGEVYRVTPSGLMAASEALRSIALRAMEDVSNR